MGRSVFCVRGQKGRKGIGGVYVTWRRREEEKNEEKEVLFLKLLSPPFFKVPRLLLEGNSVA
jgi:hypothetical protein